MWSSGSDEGLIDTLTAERDEARELARECYHALSSAERAYLRMERELPGWLTAWIEALPEAEGSG